jgi:4'-phosphopantetheinyl transferase superfamily protein
VLRLDAEVSAMLGVDVRLAWAAEATPSPGSDGRDLDWLRGRAALRALLPAGSETAGLEFPHPALSLSHAGGLAVAVRCDRNLRGIGVDFEPWRPAADLRVARFFLRPPEQAAVSGPASLMRLWTIKEALYKATPDNGSCVLVDFTLADPGGACGRAVGPRGETLRYAAVDVGEGHLAVAICEAGRRHAAV